VHIVSQSDLKAFSHCPEQHRRNMLKLDPPMQNDSALLGSAFATYPQNRINGWNPRDAYEYAANLVTFGSTELRYPLYGWNSEYLNQATFKSCAQVLWIMFEACKLCELELANLPEGTKAEVEFRELLVEDENRKVYVDGASDVWLPDSIQDWKLSGQNYEGRDGWKFQRYDPQPSHYVLGRVLKEKTFDLMDFTFVNFHRDKLIVEHLPLTIGPPELDFHADRIMNYVRFVEKNGFDDPWPLNPADWWCSITWCPAWKECRGKYIGDDPWNLREKKNKKLGIVNA